MVKRQWTVADLEDLPDDGNRYEVIDGELFVTPAPAWKHQRAIAALYSLVAEYLRSGRVGEVLFAPVDIIFSPTRGVQPDLLVVPVVDGPRPQKFADVGRLLLAVEVLSPSSARADRVAKRTLYRDEGVPEYWLVDLDARTVERSTPSEPRVEVVTDVLEWRPDGAATAFRVDLAEYFASVLGD